MAAETERRFLVDKFDPSVLAKVARRWSIAQGYFELRNPQKSFRVRVVDDGDGVRRAFITVKEGVGLTRDEQESEISLKQGQDLLAICWHTIKKTRFFKDGWEVDFYEDPLAGLVIAEYEMASQDEKVVLPPWIIGSTEVTDSITNLHLARLATELGRTNKEPLGFSVYEELLKSTRRVPRIVLTGGPCSGKSTMIEALKKELGDAIHCVPEVATVVISQVGIKPTQGALASLHFQDTIYRIQGIFEATSAEQAIGENKQALLLDRGSVDNAAYLSGGLEEMERLFGTTAQAEYSRYDLVLCLDVPSEEIFERSRTNNPARSETYEQAVALGIRIKQVWGAHPNFTAVPNGTSWQEKQETALRLVREFLAMHPEPS